MSFVEEKETIQGEIKKLRIASEKLREDADCENKLVTGKELEDYVNSGWEMAQTVNSQILVKRRF